MLLNKRAFFCHLFLSLNLVQHASEPEHERDEVAMEMQSVDVLTNDHLFALHIKSSNELVKVVKGSV